MTAEPSKPRESDAQAPFGAQPGRSKALPVFLGVLYVCWFLVLVWMAVFKPGD